MKLKITSIFALLFVLLPVTALAETLYVSDTLRVGIRTQPTNNVPSIAVVKSGTAVEVLKRKGSYIKVRTQSGVEGWVKSAYFSRKTPAARKLDNALKKIAALEKELKSLHKEQTKQQAKGVADPKLSEKIAALEKTNQNLKDELKSLRNRPMEKTDNMFSIKSISENIIYVVLGIFLVLICMGFLFGVSWHKSQVAKRLGGMSI